MKNEEFFLVNYKLLIKIIMKKINKSLILKVFNNKILTFGQNKINPVLSRRKQFDEKAD